MHEARSQTVALGAQTVCIAPITVAPAELSEPAWLGLRTSQVRAACRRRQWAKCRGRCYLTMLMHLREKRSSPGQELWRRARVLYLGQLPYRGRGKQVLLTTIKACRAGDWSSMYGR